MHMDNYIMTAIQTLRQWPRFRLRLFIEGIGVGLISGISISIFRWGLDAGTQWRQYIYTSILLDGAWYTAAAWAVVLLAAAGILWRLGMYEPPAGGSGIPQVNGIILGALRMIWFRTL